MKKPSPSTKQLINRPAVAILVALMVLSGLTGCSLLDSAPEILPGRYLPGPNQETYTPYRRYIQSMTELNRASTGNISMFNILATSSGHKIILDYYNQLFVNLGSQAKITTISAQVKYSQRSLHPAETVRNVVVIQHVDGLFTGFVVTQSQAGWRSLLIDPQGAAYELYLLAYSRGGETFFERDTADANRVLELPGLKQVYWVTARPLTAPEWERLSPEQQVLIQGQYTETRQASEPEQIQDTLRNGMGWIILPVIGWEAAVPRMTALLHPTLFHVHLEQGSGTTANGLPQPGYLRIPLGELPDQYNRVQ